VMRGENIRKEGKEHIIWNMKYYDGRGELLELMNILMIRGSGGQFGDLG